MFNGNGNFHIPNILEFLSDPNNTGIELWDIVIEGGESQEHVSFDGLKAIRCMKRSIEYVNKNVVQISSRRRVLSGSSEGKFALSKEQIQLAEKDVQRIGFQKENLLKDVNLN